MTTETVRRATQKSQANIRTLAKQYGINQKMVAKWKQRDQIQDVAMGPEAIHSTVLRAKEEAVIVPSANIRCCRSMIASMLCRRQSHT